MSYLMHANVSSNCNISKSMYEKVTGLALVGHKYEVNVTFK